MKTIESIIKSLSAISNTTTDVNTAAQLQKLIASIHNPLAIQLNRIAKTISRDGVTHELTKQEFKTLELLASTDTPLSREAILTGAWEFVHVGPRTVDVHIRKLRAKLGDDLIETRKGVGYIIAKDVEIV
jgi:DNA-binding response OmpR family regulator